MANVIMRAIELDQMRLRAPRFLPALETSFGKSMDQDARRRERNLILGGSPGYLGLSELPLPSNAVMRDSCAKFDASNASAEGSSAQILQARRKKPKPQESQETFMRSSRQDLQARMDAKMRYLQGSVGSLIMTLD